MLLDNVDVLAPFSCSKLHPDKCHGSVNFSVLSNRLRVPLKLHRLRLSPKSNRHEHESARRPSECDVVREKRLIVLIGRDGTIYAKQYLYIFF